ncbi:ABC transporter ATP-binding protein [Lysinibacter sp. HNR]|uniref:ATP-binding cassette domain-containing protein n=1 Tax=Lysinibacter sp. HNR TaxID=3031408 RepID=UPI00243500F9|nr:ABC transporter ATP-binding protein [Lysinibacter sp. HNR]WGD37910.1 ABC transporter ATP-binding protein [Lysinibacter sp. HNR]
MTSILRIADLSITTSTGARVLDGVDLEISRGERVGLIGESGSGKSLTALASVGLLPRSMSVTGSILLDSTQVVGASERQLIPLRGSVASLVFQEPLTALDPLMRLGNQLKVPLRRHQKISGVRLEDAVTAALREVQIEDTERISRSYPHEVSGGQRQRVAIALALACLPQLLIADEPTTALDVTVQADVLDLLDTLVKERGMALLFISHDLAVVSRITRRAVVLQRGSLVEDGPISRILSDPQHPYTQDLVTSARELDSVLDGLATSERSGAVGEETP